MYNVKIIIASYLGHWEYYPCFKSILTWKIPSPWNSNHGSWNKCFMEISCPMKSHFMFFKIFMAMKVFHGSWILILWISWQINAPLNPIWLYFKVFHGHESVFHGSWIILLQISWQIHGFEKGHEKENLYFHGHEKWVHGFLMNF